MNSEHDHAAWLNENTGEAAQEAYNYFMRPDPQQRQLMGPVEEEYDELTGSTARYRWAKVGMVRNAPEESLREVKVYLGFDDKLYLPHIRIDHAKPLQGWYQDRDNQKKGSRPRPCFTEAILTEPYGGYCTVGCAFCYVNSGFRGYRGTGLISVPVKYGSQVAKMLSKTRSSAAGYFSSFTDPFLPIEEIYHNTQEGATEFVRLGLPIFFLSRLSYPSWAIDLLKKSPYSYAQKSLNTGNDEDWQKLSPGAIPLQDHLDEIRELRKNLIYTSIQVNPVVPGITTHDHIRRLFERLAEVGNNHVIVKFVEAGYSWAPTMVERLFKRFGPERAGAFNLLFTENQPGSQRTINQAYRTEAHQLYQSWATELGMTYATCYEYAKTPDGWISLGRQFTTADQCHGHRVPMFSRPTTEDEFTEVGVCAPSGCMYCAPDLDSKKAPCGSERFGSAKALRAPDYKHPVGPEEPNPKRVIPIVSA